VRSERERESRKLVLVLPTFDTARTSSKVNLTNFSLSSFHLSLPFWWSSSSTPLSHLSIGTSLRKNLDSFSPTLFGSPFLTASTRPYSPYSCSSSSSSSTVVSASSSSDEREVFAVDDEEAAVGVVVEGSNDVDNDLSGSFSSGVNHQCTNVVPRSMSCSRCALVSQSLSLYGRAEERKEERRRTCVSPLKTARETSRL
jgi:hypothetical protein